MDRFSNPGAHGHYTLKHEFHAKLRPGICPYEDEHDRQYFIREVARRSQLNSQGNFSGKHQLPSAEDYSIPTKRLEHRQGISKLKIYWYILISDQIIQGPNWLLASSEHPSSPASYAIHGTYPDTRSQLKFSQRSCIWKEAGGGQNTSRYGERLYSSVESRKQLTERNLLLEVRIKVLEGIWGVCFFVDR